MVDFRIQPVGVVESSLAHPTDAPRQEDEGAPEAWLVIDSAFAEGLHDVRPGAELWVLTWFHLSRRNVLKVHPRDDLSQPLTGVFSTRSPERPNPIGLHRVRVLEVAGTRVRVDHLEAVNGTPIVDLKPVSSTQSTVV